MAEPPADDLLSRARQLFEGGQPNEALALLRDAAARQSGNADIFNLAGECLLQLRDFDAALDAFQRAARARSDWPAPYLGAAAALAGRGDAYGSMQALLHVLDFAPRDLHATRQLQELLTRLRPTRYLPALEPALLACFAHPDNDPASLSALCAQHLRLGLEKAAPGFQELAPETALARISDSRLWQLYLSRVVNADAEIERLLTAVRRHLCLNVRPEDGDLSQASFTAALAQQCFLNEYVFDTSEEETRTLDTLEAVIEQAGDASASAALAFVLTCLYRPPANIPAARALGQTLGNRYEWLEDLCRLAVLEPLEEAEIAKKLPVLRPVHRESSLAVQAQYESNPYPRWRAPPAPRQADFLGSIRKQFSQRHELRHSQSAETRILVAGCGTGFEPIDIARRDHGARITAIDLSRSSLAYAKRQADALQLLNVEFLQGDILDLPGTGWEFDVIVCTGVLHHMEDPLLGWEALRDVLAENGMMRVGLYSAIARRSVARARAIIEDRGLTAQLEDIRRFRRWLLGGAGDAELQDLLWSDDFFSVSGCRDLLFHTLEHQFSLPEIRSALDGLGLRFCGFDPANANVLRTFSAAHPGSDALLDLDTWDRFEQANPTVFAEMYQFWCEHVPRAR